jgi:anti-sigma B factor antagonist
MVLQIESKRVAPDITLVEIVGKISLGRESQKIETLVQDLLRQNEKKLVFDMSRVDHMDSTGIGIMAYCFGTLNRCGGELRLAGATGKVLHLLQITRLDKVLPLYDSVEAACASLGAETPH